MKVIKVTHVVCISIIACFSVIVCKAFEASSATKNYPVWIKSGYIYSEYDTHYLPDNTMLVTNDSTDSFVRNVVWDKSEVSSRITKYFPNVVKNGFFKLLSNENFAHYNISLAKVQVFDDSLATMISEIDTSAFHSVSFFNDYAVARSADSKIIRFFPLTQANSTFELTLEDSSVNQSLQTVLHVGQYIAICQTSSISFYDQVSHDFVKKVIINNCAYFRSHNDEIYCFASNPNENIYKFKPTLIPNGYLIGIMQKINVNEYLQQIFGGDSITGQQILSARIVDGMMHMVMRVRYQSNHQGSDRFSNKATDVYFVVDLNSGLISFQSNFDASEFYNTQLTMYIDGSKTLISRRQATRLVDDINTYENFYFERNPTWPIIDVQTRASFAEGESVMVDLSLRSPSAVDISLNYTTLDGTAKSGEDYVASSGIIHFPAGDVFKSVAIPIKLDKIAEGIESFALSIQPSNDYVINKNKIICMIVDGKKPYLQATLMPNDFIDDKSADYIQFAEYDDCLLMYRWIKEKYQFTIFDPNSYKPLRDLVMPENISMKLGNSVRRTAKFGDKIIVALERTTEGMFLAFSSTTGELLSEFSMTYDIRSRQSFTILDEDTVIGANRDFRMVYSITGEKQYQIDKPYRLIGLDKDGNIQVLRSISAEISRYEVETVDIRTGNVLSKVEFDHIHNSPVKLYQGKVLCVSYNQTYCYDADTGHLLWANYSSSPIIDIYDEQILVQNGVYDLNTGALLEEFNIAHELAGFMGKQIYTKLGTLQPIIYYRKFANPLYPESTINQFFVRRGQGHRMLTIPLSAPLPNDSNITFEPKSGSGILRVASVKVPSGATYFQIPIFVPDEYVHTDYYNQNRDINQTRILAIQNLETGYKYSQEIGLHVISPDFNDLGLPNTAIPTVRIDSNTKNIYKFLANEEYFLVKHGSFDHAFGTKIDIYSASLQRKIFTIAADPNDPSKVNYAHSMALHDKYLFVSCLGYKSDNNNVSSSSGYVDIYDLERMEKVSTIRGPAKDFGFGLALAVNERFLAVTSQNVAFEKLNLNSDRKPLKYSGKVFLYQLTTITQPTMLATLTGKDSGFGSSLAMSNECVFISAPHAHVNFKPAGSKKSLKASYSGVVYRYSLSNTKQAASVVRMPVPFPLAEFGHSISIKNDDLCVACERNNVLGTTYFPQTYIAPQGYSFNTNSLDLTGWLTLPQRYSSITQGGHFIGANRMLYSIDTASFTSNIETDYFCFYDDRVACIQRDPYTNALFFYTRPLELSGDFSYWSRLKLGNYSELDASLDFNKNGISDWQEFLLEHRNFFRNPLLYEEINSQGYGNFNVDYEHTTKFPLPAAGSWADWINQ